MADFELLVKGLHELEMKPLILCMPPNGICLEQKGIPKKSIAHLQARVRRIGSKYGATVKTFDDHVEDPAFLADEHDHLSAKGWMHYNHALALFYHETPP